MNRVTSPPFKTVRGREDNVFADEASSTHRLAVQQQLGLMGKNQHKIYKSNRIMNLKHHQGKKYQ